MVVYTKKPCSFLVSLASTASVGRLFWRSRHNVHINLTALSPETTVRGRSKRLVATYRPAWSSSERRSAGMAAFGQIALGFVPLIALARSNPAVLSGICATKVKEVSDPFQALPRTRWSDKSPVRGSKRWLPNKRVNKNTTLKSNNDQRTHAKHSRPPNALPVLISLPASFP